MAKIKEDLKTNREVRMMEVRADDQEEGKMIVEGYAAVFDQETFIGCNEWDFGWYEKIDRHAFDETDMEDACLKYNHGDTKGVLARTRNKSLQLSIDEVGLKVRAELIDTSDNIDIYKGVKAGLYDKMSFAFTIAKDGDEVTEDSDGTLRRTITKIAKLWDCAIVDVPAYDGTSIYARSKEIVGEQLRNLQPSVDTGEVVSEDTNKNQVELEKLKIEILYGKDE